MEILSDICEHPPQIEISDEFSGDIKIVVPNLSHFSNTFVARFKTEFLSLNRLVTNISSLISVTKIMFFVVGNTRERNNLMLHFNLEVT